MSLYLCGVGTAVPPFGMDQAESAEIVEGFSFLSAEQKRLLAALYRRAGVKHRHSALLESETGPLGSRQSFFPIAGSAEDRGPSTGARMEQFEIHAGALAAVAAKRALDDAGIEPDAVSNLVTVSCSGFCAPGFDVTLVRDLPLRAGTTRTQVGFMGCHGALNALRVARGYAAADPQSYTLICCVELCSLHHQYGWDPDQIVANALFADGAAAVVCRGMTCEDGPVWRVVDNGSTIIPDTSDAMRWRIGDHGFEMTLSPGVPELIHRHLRPWLESWLRRNSLDIERVRSWAIHPGGPRILSACAEALGIAREHLDDSLGVLARFGNMSSPTVLFILDELRKRNAPTPCVMLGFGPGLTIEAALLGR